MEEAQTIVGQMGLDDFFTLDEKGSVVYQPCTDCGHAHRSPDGVCECGCERYREPEESR